MSTTSAVCTGLFPIILESRESLTYCCAIPEIGTTIIISSQYLNTRYYRGTGTAHER